MAQRTDGDVAESRARLKGDVAHEDGVEDLGAARPSNCDGAARGRSRGGPPPPTTLTSAGRDIVCGSVRFLPRRILLVSIALFGTAFGIYGTVADLFKSVT